LEKEKEKEKPFTNIKWVFELPALCKHPKGIYVIKLKIRIYLFIYSYIFYNNLFL